MQDLEDKNSQKTKKELKMGMEKLFIEMRREFELISLERESESQQ